MIKNKIFKAYFQRKRTSFDNFEFENLTFGLCLFYIIDPFTMLYAMYFHMNVYFNIYFYVCIF